MPVFSEYWTKKQLQAACRERGISYYGLNKCDLIDELNSNVDHSWTKRELKEECGRRGLRNFNRLTKDGLIQLLNNYNAGGAGTPWAPPASQPQAAPTNTMAEVLHTARVQAQSGQRDLAIQNFRTYLGHLTVVDPHWRAVDMEMEVCIYHDQLEEAHEHSEMCERVQEERREAERQERLRAKEDAMAEAAEVEERRQAELREHLRAAEAAAAAAEAAEAEEERRQAELQENWRAAEAAAAAALAEVQYQRSLAEEWQRMEAEVQARINQRHGTAPGPGSWSIGRARGTSSTAQAGAQASASSSTLRSMPGPTSASPSSSSGTVQGHNGSSSGNNNGNNSSNDCVICMDVEVNCTLVPCGHHCCCYDCASGFDQCPVCRSRVDMKVKTYRA